MSVPPEKPESRRCVLVAYSVSAEKIISDAFSYSENI